MTNPQLVAAGIVLSAFAFALTVTALIAARRMATLGELVPYQPGPRGKSGLLEFAVAISALFVGQIVGVNAAKFFEREAPGERATVVASDLPGDAGQIDARNAAAQRIDVPTLVGAWGGALVGVLAVYLLWRVVLDRGPYLFAQTQKLSAFGADAALGFWAFLMSAAPVYGLQALLIQFYPQRHAVIDRLESGLDPAIFMAAAFSAVIAAPLTEEIVFRGFLLTAFSHVRLGLPESWGRALFGAPVTSPNSEAGETIDRPDYESPAEFRERGGTLAEGFRRTLAGMASFPVVASSALFAALHLGQGPAPIPLFLFSLMLGYVCRQTGRVTPSIVAHFALNGTTILLTGLSALNGPEKPQPIVAIDAVSVEASRSEMPLSRAETVLLPEGLR